MIDSPPDRADASRQAKRLPLVKPELVNAPTHAAGLVLSLIDFAAVELEQWLRFRTPQPIKNP